MSPTVTSLTYRSGSNMEPVFARTKPGFINAVLLLAGVESFVDVPDSADICIFSGNGDFYVRPDALAALPIADITDGSAAELNPAQWDVHDVSRLHLIAPEDTVVTLSFYK